MWRTSHVYLLATLAVTLASCGGGAPGPVPSVTVASSPLAPPAPIPTPPSPSVLRYAGAAPGDTLVGVESCAQGPATRDARGHLAEVTFSSAKIDNSIRLTYGAVDTFSIDTNGFGGPSFRPVDKQPWTGGPYDQFLNPSQGELFVLRNGESHFAAVGLDTSYAACFFAIGMEPDTLPAFKQDYFVTVDGLARVGTRTMRLFGYDSEMILDPTTGTAILKLKLAGRDAPFGDFHSRTPTPLVEATASLTLRANGSFSTATLSGGGFVGQVMGRLVSVAAGNVSGRGGAGAVFTFELRSSQGEFIFGVLAAEANLI